MWLKDAKSREKEAFGITVDSKMLSVHARLLDAPQIIYNDELVTPQLANWNMIRKQFVHPGPISTWSRLNLSGERLPEKYLEDFQSALEKCGMGKTRPFLHHGFEGKLSGFSDDNANDKEIQEKMEQISKTDVEILLVVLPFKSTPIYARVKYWADVKYGKIWRKCRLIEKFSNF